MPGVLQGRQGRGMRRPEMAAGEGAAHARLAWAGLGGRMPCAESMRAWHSVTHTRALQSHLLLPCTRRTMDGKSVWCSACAATLTMPRVGLPSRARALALHSSPLAAPSTTWCRAGAACPAAAGRQNAEVRPPGSWAAYTECSILQSSGPSDGVCRCWWPSLQAHSKCTSRQACCWPPCGMP